MNKASLDFANILTSNKQKELREEAQKYVDRLYELGTPVRIVKILGNWHSVYKGKILKAPIPWNFVNDKQILSFLDSHE